MEGLGEIPHGGLPSGRTALLAGSAGAGKTVVGIEFLVHGILDYNEPGAVDGFRIQKASRRLKCVRKKQASGWGKDGRID